MKMTRYSTCVFWLACTLLGQNPRLSSVRGEVQGAVPQEAQVELQSCVGGQPGGNNVAQVAANGAFEFRGVEPGCYRVTVTSPLTGRKVYDSVHDVGRQTGGLELRVKETPAERPVAGGVALGQLRPKPPKKAVRQLEAAGRLSSAGQFAAAAEQLRATVAAYPSFAEAHINLGAQLARLGEPAAALAEFEQARLLGVDEAALWTNIAAAQLELKSLDAAQAAITNALGKDNTYPQAHFIAGQILLRRQRVDEAIAEFRRAEGVPGSALMLAQIFLRTGHKPEAAQELKAYLASGHPTYRPVAERLLREIGR
jgi:tetratricopeptide (TPR) repeat protein